MPDLSYKNIRGQILYDVIDTLFDFSKYSIEKFRFLFPNAERELALFLNDILCCKNVFGNVSVWLIYYCEEMCVNSYCFNGASFCLD